jgi:hypothetical protein
VKGARSVFAANQAAVYREIKYFANSLLSCNHSRNPLSPELNPVSYLLALLAHDFLHVRRIRVKSLTLRLLMSYMYMEHLFLMFLDHTQRRSTVGRTSLNELVAETST